MHRNGYDLQRLEATSLATDAPLTNISETPSPSQNVSTANSMTTDVAATAQSVVQIGRSSNRHNHNRTNTSRFDNISA
ncbi:hypothetical protein EVAR_72444_1 [Eumeta japonica]|uniref:Uncharacterized protein n=1 Tax=Eumeta variegata TaxID=151549 RepID=A0A4C1TQD8_EUMVA|nr:hypothetical protein EVAR_72444_1 [Eumeta japonica]